ncbi:hypothetical protein TELCIR_06708 [Teladorsagia circumcincta]|uniref:Uncharacterized protein n=1 Tax=Teladorsagia circumcincta TaxID=45464 RepID=A0A2G9UPL9_TELCI|nr:hypothetical protein TELCIR_06708 [Teladorsagia circumcincta]
MQYAAMIISTAALKIHSATLTDFSALEQMVKCFRQEGSPKHKNSRKRTKLSVLIDGANAQQEARAVCL